MCGLMSSSRGWVGLGVRWVWGARLNQHVSWLLHPLPQVTAHHVTVQHRPWQRQLPDLQSPCPQSRGLSKAPLPNAGTSGILSQPHSEGQDCGGGGLLASHLFSRRAGGGRVEGHAAGGSGQHPLLAQGTGPVKAGVRL